MAHDLSALMGLRIAVDFKFLLVRVGMIAFRFLLCWIRNWKSSPVLKDSFPGYRILAFQFLNFSTLSTSSPYLLAFLFSDYISAVDLIEDGLHVMSQFSHASGFSVSGFQ